MLEEDLREYFGQYGNITDIVIKSPKEGVRVRAFAFITFDDYDPVDKVISKNKLNSNLYYITISFLGLVKQIAISPIFDPIYSNRNK